MTVALQVNPYLRARTLFREDFKNGIKPVDGRQPIPDELALEMIGNLNVPKDSVIGVYDAFLILSTHLKEQGYNNIVVLENTHSNLTSSQEKYYNIVKKTCENTGIKYYVPPMNNYNRCDMKFDVIIGNPPYSDTSSGSTNTKGIDDKFFEFAVNNSDHVCMIIRSKHFCNQSSSFRKRLFESGKVSKIQYLAEDTFKGFIVRTCIVTCGYNQNGNTDIVTLDGNVSNVKLNSDTIIHPNKGVLTSPLNNLGKRWKRGKLHLNQIVESQSGVTFVKALGRRDSEIDTCVIDPSLENFGYGKYGVLIPNMGTANGGIGKVVVKPANSTAGHSIVQLWTDTEEEANRLAEYLQSEEIVSFIRDIKFSNPNPKSLFSLIPDPL